MFGCRLCLATSPDFKLPITDQIKLFKRIGFDGFLPPGVPTNPLQNMRVLPSKPV